MMMEFGQRAPTTVRLIGRAARSSVWREAFITDGLVVPVGGSCTVGFVDLSGSRSLDHDLAAARHLAGSTPLVALIGKADALPLDPQPGVVVIRRSGASTLPVSRALKRAAHQHRIVASAALRFKALGGMGVLYDGIPQSTEPGPAALLTESNPDVLPLIQSTKRTDLIAALTSSHTLRLLENDHASALVINLAEQLEHRLPVLKLIRRQSEIHGLPVAVLCKDWDDEAADQWLGAGADLLAHPDEIDGVLTFLQGASIRFRTQRALTNSLVSTSVDALGQPSPIFGRDVFARILAEHHAQGDSIAYGAIELSPEGHGREDDVAEAGIYMSMALSPLELVYRARPNLFVVAMPYADRFYARRTMRTLQTLVEDLKFGEEPDPILMSAQQTTRTVVGEAPEEAIANLSKQLAAARRAPAIA